MGKKTIFQNCFAVILVVPVFLPLVLFCTGCSQDSVDDPVNIVPLPEIPKNVLVIPGDQKLVVNWDMAANASSYELFWNAEGGAEQPIESDAATITIGGLENGTGYWIKVRSTNSEGISGFSPPVKGIPAIQEFLDDFVYVQGGTVTGSSSYAMSVTVPTDPPGYMNAGNTLSRQGVFTEGRTVSIDSFYMARYETTKKLWYKVQVWAEGYYFQNKITAPKQADENKPVTGINWRDAIVWCNAYSEMNGQEPVYYYENNILKDSRDSNAAACDNAVMQKNKNGYRLPTEVEREYAARGGNPAGADWMFTYSGSSNADDAAWHHGNSPYTVRDVGGKKPNRLGIFDLSGNVQEWGWGWMNYGVNAAPDTPLDGESYGSPYVQVPMAGGGVGSNITMSCVAYRWGYTTAYKDAFVGFRVMRNID